jgi:hypothetical protein
MAFKLEIRAGSAAFDGDPIAELRKIMGYVADSLCAGYTSGKAIDSNGNSVGEWSFMDVPRCAICGASNDVKDYKGYRLCEACRVEKDAQDEEEADENREEDKED